MNLAKPRFVMTTSWDDGHPYDLRLAKLLAKYALSGTFYVPRSGPRAVMSVAAIRELAHAFEIGAHTLEHLALNRLSESDTMTQLCGSRGWIEDVTGSPCRTFCFPEGKFRQGQLRLVREAGFAAARTTELLSNDYPRCVHGLFVIRTTVQAFPHRPIAYVKNSLRRLSPAVIFAPPRALRSGDWVALAKALFLRTKSHGGVFHLWGHSWEIAEHLQWRALEEFLAFAGAHLEDSKCISNGELCAWMEHEIPHEDSVAPMQRTGGAEQGRPPRALENERP
jgi:peptidoglycan-N-acetylglucosamine deacetylase